jgi:carbonyl reductase 1
MSSARIALVTGANQGIGFALASGLAAQVAPEDLVLLTGRNPARGDPRSTRCAAAGAA